MITAYQKYLQRLDDQSVWTERDIRSFRKAVGNNGLTDPTQRASLLTRFRARAFLGVYRLTPAHDVKGQQYLLKHTVRLNGELRKGAKLGWREVDILKRLSHHLLVDVRRGLAVYRAVADNGDSFEYIGTTYQQVEVVG